MYIVDHVYEVLSKIDISDDFSIRRQKEKAFAYYQALRIQYHRPDRIHDVIERQNYDLQYMQGANHELVQFKEYVVEMIRDASRMVGDVLFQSMAVAFLDYLISDVFWKLVNEKSFIWVESHFQQTQELVVNRLLSVDPDLKKMTLEAFITGYDASITVFEKNAFLGFGDEEEEEYSSEEMDAMIAMLKASQPPSDQNPSVVNEDNFQEEEVESYEWTPERQLEEMENRFSHYYHHIINCMKGIETHGFFPFFYVPTHTSMSHWTDEEDLNLEQVNLIVERLQKVDYPGHRVKVQLAKMNENRYVIEASWEKQSCSNKN